MDESALALKCGLEIHQQLNTGKLFCRCPSEISEGSPNTTFERSLRASAGETGDVDAAARHEAARGKRFQYNMYEATCCLVEMDEEPPHPLSEPALLAAMQSATLFDSTILCDIAVMRKTVIDGSNTGGFQRTALVALGGKLPSQDVRIQTVCLEEDAAKIVSRSGDIDTYNLSRLGIPLIEVATEPDITTPEQAQRVAAEIGMVLRSTGACKRGLGTIRQDLNVSIKGGARVEIKGAQDLRLLPELVRNEMMRQAGLLATMERLKGTKSILLPAPKNVSAQLKDTECMLVRRAMKAGAAVMGVAIPGFANLLGEELYPGYRLGTELAGYAKAFGFGGIIHSDEDSKKYKFTEQEIAALRKKLGTKKDDAFILILGEPTRVTNLLAFLLLPRLEQLLRGVPSEVRRANADGSSTFMRPMPGAARMYPETDIPRVRAPTKFPIPKLLDEQRVELAKLHGISEDHAAQLLREGWDFASYVTHFARLSPVFLATTLLEAPKELQRRYGRTINLQDHEQVLKDILRKASTGKIPREAVIELLAQVADGKTPDYSRFATQDDGAIRTAVDKVIKADPAAPINALMGMVMKELRGKANGKDVMRILKEVKS